MRIAAALAALTVAACATTPEEIIREVEVLKEVPVSCTPELPQEPVYPDIDLSQIDNIEIGVRRLYIARDLRIIRIDQLEEALEGCKNFTEPVE